MDRDLWSGLAVFETIVEAGSFARAATRLGLSASALSHAMRSLETKLGVRLLDRTTRSLAPTPAGEELLARLRPAIASVAGALADLDNARERPAGRIRVSAHRVAAIYAILTRLADFAQAYPDIAVELVVNDGFVDIVADRFDCGVRHAQSLQADMISVRISAPVPLVLSPHRPTSPIIPLPSIPTISPLIVVCVTDTRPLASYTAGNLSGMAGRWNGQSAGTSSLTISA